MNRFRLPLPRQISITPDVCLADLAPPCYIEVEILAHDVDKMETTLQATLGSGIYMYGTPVLVVIDEIAAYHDRLRQLLLQELVPDLRLL